MLSKRVNVFLERARNLQSTSPKPKSKSPFKVVEESRVDSLIRETDDVVFNLENMIEAFVKNRNDANKRIENSKVKEMKFIEEVKKSLQVEIRKSKSTGIADVEKEYKEKTQQIMTVIKQETMAIDKKLADLTTENSRLKKILTEKNIENVDKKILAEKVTIEKALDALAKRAGERTDGRIEQLAKIESPAYEKQAKKKIKEIIGSEFGIRDLIAREIRNRASQWVGRLGYLEEMIEDRRIKYEELDKKIKQCYKEPRRKAKIEFEDEIFQTRENRSATFGKMPVGQKPTLVPVETLSEESQLKTSSLATDESCSLFPFISPESILSNIYSEILNEASHD